MTVKELYDKAVIYGLQDEPFDDVKLLFSVPLGRGVCGMCKNRKADKCPWPNFSKPTIPICLSFIAKEVANE